MQGRRPEPGRHIERVMVNFKTEGSTTGGLRVLSVLLGVFLVFMGQSKLAWFGDSGHLVEELEGWRGFAPAASRWYLEAVAIPAAPIFARLVPLGELVTGAALVAGVRVRLAATVALVMILNFHVAMGVIFTFGYLTNGYGLPVVGGLLALSIGGTKLPLSLGR